MSFFHIEFIFNLCVRKHMRRYQEISFFYQTFIFVFYFQITPKSIDLSERDAPKKIQVTSTVPIVCEDGTEDCRVLVELGQTNTDNFIDYCTLSFKPGPSGKTEELEVVAKRDFVDDGDQTMFLKLHIPDHIDPSDWNCYKNITSIKVSLLSWSALLIQSHGNLDFFCRQKALSFHNELRPQYKSHWSKVVNLFDVGITFTRAMSMAILHIVIIVSC